MKPRYSFSEKMTRQAPEALSPAADAAPVEAPDYSFIPADFVVDGKPDTARFTEHYQELLAADAQRKETVVPEEYAFAVPEGLTYDGLELPEGFAVQLAADDPDFQPLFGEMGGLLKELGAPAEAAGKAAALIARYEAIKASKALKAENEAFAAWETEMKTLGNEAQVKARVAAVERKLETMLPAEQVKALFSGERISANGIKALEKIISTQRLTSVPPVPPSNADLEGLSAFERLKVINARQAKTA